VRFIDGTHLLITFRGTSILGEIFLASRDGFSLVVRFDGALGPYDQLMPLMWAGDGYKDLLEGVYVGLLKLVELTPGFQSRLTRVWVYRPVSSVPSPRTARNGDVQP
jgi:hypothetical protein